jgi:hypothetical protein
MTAKGLQKNEISGLPMIAAGRFKVTVTDQRDRSCGFVAHLEVNTSHGWQGMDAVLGFENATEALLGGKRVLVSYMTEAIGRMDVTAEEIESLA